MKTAKIRLKKGELIKYGYRVMLPEKQRRKSLKRAYKEFPNLTRKLNVLALFNKNKHQEITRRVKRDIQYIKKLKLNL